MTRFKFEVFEGHFVYNPGQIDRYNGADFYYCAVLKWSNDSSWLKFSQAKSGCISVLRKNLDTLRKTNNNKKEITLLKNLVSRLVGIDETKVLDTCSSEDGEMKI